MSVRFLSIPLAFAAAFTLSVGVPAFVSGAGSLKEDEVQLSGCLVRGDGDREGYLLTNSSTETWLQSSDTHAMPSAVGTSGDLATVFYWLDGSGDLRKHIGHRVEIEGDLGVDVKDGEIEVDRKDKWTEVTVKSDGRSLKANVPHPAVVIGSVDDDKKAHILVRRVNVEKVRMIDASCQ